MSGLSVVSQEGESSEKVAYYCVLENARQAAVSQIRLCRDAREKLSVPSASTVLTFLRF